MDPEFKRFYDARYDRVYYSGTAGLVSKAMHLALERGHSGKHFAKVLELGAGHGEHIEFVRHSFDEYLCTDLEDHWIRGKQGKRNVSYQRADATALDFPDKTFDRVLHACLLHHLAEPEKALSEIRRVTKIGGTATIYVSCDPGLVYRLGQRVFARRSIATALQLGGFSFTPDYWKAIEHRSHYPAIRALINHVFGEDHVRQHCYPLPFDSADFNVFNVFNIVRKH